MSPSLETVLASALASPNGPARIAAIVVAAVGGNAATLEASFRSAMDSNDLRAAGAQAQAARVAFLIRAQGQSAIDKVIATL